MVIRYCPRCPFFSEQFTKVVSHIGIVHGGEANFSIFCGIDGCPSTYKSFVSYRTHLYRRHRGTLHECGSRLAATETSDASAHASELQHEVLPEDPGEASTSAAEFEGEDDSRKEAQWSDFVDDARAAMISMFLNITEQHKLPQTVAAKIFGELRVVFEYVVQGFADQITQKIEKSAPSSEIQSLLNCSFLETLFEGIESKHKREEYVKKHFPYVEPEEHRLGTQGAKFHYIPIQSVLNNLCKVPDIAAHLAIPPVTSAATEVYKDYTQGLLYKEHFRDLIPEGCQFTMFLIIYMDEIEIVNPLGPKRGKHKLLAIYFSVLNLHVKYRSKLRSIHLLILAKYVHVQMHGLGAVLCPLLKDLSNLRENGLTFAKDGFIQHAAVFTFCMCGDNLSMNKVGGFSCCFSRGRVCRYCLASSTELSKLTSEAVCHLRTAAGHRRHLEAIRISSALSKRLYGVNEASPLLELDYFDVTRQLPPDIMHDILEGGFECVLRNILKSMIADSSLRYGDLERIISFDYGFNDRKNRPVEICRSFLVSHANLKGTASQKWCLMRLLPLILGEVVAVDNPDWELFLQFREIIDIVFASQLPCEWLPFLEVQVQTFLTEFAERYGTASIIPKLHYLVHYARYVREVGPLVQFWAMRFEAKHQYFKSLARRIQNFRNVTKTLANRHQLMQSHELKECTLYESLATAHGKQVDLTSVPECARNALDDHAHEVATASLDHRSYRRGDVLVERSNCQPIFSQIDALYVSRGRLFILLNDLTVEGFDRHRFCFSVSRSGQLRLTEPETNTEHCALDLYNGGQVVLKWEVV